MWPDFLPKSTYLLWWKKMPYCKNNQNWRIHQTSSLSNTVTEGVLLKCHCVDMSDWIIGHLCMNFITRPGVGAQMLKVLTLWSLVWIFWWAAPFWSYPEHTPPAPCLCSRIMSLVYKRVNSKHLRSYARNPKQRQ